MKHLFKKLALAGLLMFSPFFPGNENSAQAELGETYKPFSGICLGPFREGQSPELGIYPSELQSRQDIGICHDLAGAVRTYGVDNILFRFAEFCRDENINCYPACWIDNQSWDGIQVTNLINVAKLGYKTTKKLIVGNEFLYRHPAMESYHINFINNVKAQTGMPVTAAEQWHVYRDHPNLANAVDSIMIHVHPYWENQSIENAADFVLEKYNYIKSLYPGKQVIIRETGWPCHRGTRRMAVPSMENQKKFISDLKRVAEQNRMDYMIFEAFDEPWKQKYGDVEDSWGVMGKDRKLKSGLKDILSENTEITSITNTERALSLKTYEGDSYRIDGKNSLAGADWSAVTNFTGVAGTNSTFVNLPASTNRAGFYRAVLSLN